MRALSTHRVSHRPVFPLALLSLPPIMTTPMAVDKAKAPKIDIDEFLTLAISETPQELHAFFESFRTLYSRKYVNQSYSPLGKRMLIMSEDYGIS